MSRGTSDRGELYTEEEEEEEEEEEKEEEDQLSLEDEEELACINSVQRKREKNLRDDGGFFFGLQKEKGHCISPLFFPKKGRKEILFLGGGRRNVKMVKRLTFFFFSLPFFRE